MEGDHAIAIVGVGCKYPGADNLEEFWKVLLNGENHVHEISSDRWNLDAFYSADPDEKGKTYVRRAGLLKNHDVWDNKLFGISDVEAEKIDPQQRYVLDCVHMALEDGGIIRQDINGSDTGVYVGFMNDDYRSAITDGLDSVTNYSLTGTAPSIISARVSYVYNLLGPSLTIDTACSSALVAVDVAVQALKSGRCKMAIAGGVNSILYPDMFVGLSRARMVSPTGQSQAFSENADGYARGEGCGIVILKTLKQALKDNNKIWALIATGCNQDGRTTTPITAPSGSQQTQLLESVYAENKVDPADINVIEAHGTGTPVGDPIEANALGNFFGNLARNGHPVYIGSVKTNIGHTESAAGTAGLIKILLMMKYKTIVPSLHFKKSNPKINFSNFKFEVPLTSKEWKTPSTGHRSACVNSFGFGGTNSHAIVKEFIPVKKHEEQAPKNKTSQLIVFSATDQSGLCLNIANFLQTLYRGNYTVKELSYTSLCRRDHFQYREAVVTNDLNDLKQQCTEILSKLNEEKFQPKKPPRVIAVFCGVGTTWTGMGHELLKQEPVFKESIEKIDFLLKTLFKVTVKQIFEQKQPLTNGFLSHMAIFSCQVALWNLWIHWGLKVDAVVGQSVGEVAAAYASGALSLETAVKVIYFRSLALSKVSGGRMFVVGNCDTQLVDEACELFDGKACVAVYSSSNFCTVACQENILDKLQSTLKETKRNGNDIFIRDLTVDCAYHSPCTEAASIELEEVLHDMKGLGGKIQMISTVTGNTIKASLISSPSYWKENIRKPVLFKQAIISSGKTEKRNLFLEIGPKPVLHVHLKDSYTPVDACCLSSMKEGKELDTLKNSLQELFKNGVKLDWKRVCGESGCLVDIPKYVFNGTKRLFQPEQRRIKNEGLKLNVTSKHLFVSKADIDDCSFKVKIDPINTPFVYEHFVADTIVVPGAFHAEIALEVGRTMLQARPHDVEVSVKFLHPFSLLPGKPTNANVTVEKINDQNAYRGEIKRENGILANFRVQPKDNENRTAAVDIEKIRANCLEFQDSRFIYDSLTSLGFSYGKDLQILNDVWKNDNECLVELKPSDNIWKDVTTTHFHPVIIDGLLQMLGILESLEDPNRTLMPSSIGKLNFNGVLERKMFGYARKMFVSDVFIVYNMLLLNSEGHVIAELKDFRIQVVGESVSAYTEYFYQVKWEPIRINANSAVVSEKWKGNMALFGFDKRILEEVKDVFNDCNTLPHVLQNGMLHELKEMFRKVIHGSFSKICFISGVYTEGEISGEKLVEIVNRNCISCLALLQSLLSSSNQVQVFVITVKTQVLDESRPDISVNMIGSELWGQVRSSVWEKHLQLKLVDVHTSFREASCFLRQIVVEDLKELENTGEFIIKTDSILTNTIQCLAEDMSNIKYRKATFDDNCIVELRSFSNRNTNDMFCLLIENKTSSPKNTVSLHVHEMHQHPKFLFPEVLSEPKNLDVWTEENEDGHPVLTLEVTGTLKQNSSMGCSDKEIYVACYPIIASNVVTIPDVCILKTSLLPFYRPGMITMSVLLMSLVNETERCDEVFILHDKSNIFEAQLLQFFLESVKDCQVEITDDTSKALTGRIIIPLICVDSSFFADINDYLSARGKSKKIITLSSFVKADNLRFFSIKNNNVEIHIIDTKDALSKRKMTSCVPKVFHFLMNSSWPVTLGQLGNKDVSLSLQSRQLVPIPLRMSSLIEKMELKVSSENPFRRDGCYVVVGGLTGLGWEIVKFLADKGAGIIVSLSRRKADQTKLDHINKISNRSGCVIYSFSSDITQMEDVRQVFKLIRDTVKCPIKGIFQGAGVLKDSMFEKMNEGHFRDVLRPKVLGTWNLHLVSLDLPLDYFVMHSSVTSVFGNQGQSNYGAANAFMDTLAFYRNSIGLCGQSINWGPLAVGMAVYDSNLEDHLKSLGYYSLNVSKVHECLLICLNSRMCQIVCGCFDWGIIGNVLMSVKSKYVFPRFQQILDKNNSRLAPGTGIELSKTDDILFSMKEGKEHQEMIRQMVFKTAEEVFFTDNALFTENTSISDLGIDSMEAMTFVNRMNERVNYRMPVITLLSDNITLEKLTTLFCEKIESGSQSRKKKEHKIDESVFCSMTPMEKQIFDALKANPSNPSLFMFADIEVSKNLADAQFWIELLICVHRKHAALRTLFVNTDENVRYGIKKMILDPNETKIDFQKVEMAELMHKERIPSKLERYMFDPSKNLPLRTLFALDKEQCILRFIFSHICFDLSSVWTVMEDIKEAGTKDIKIIKHNQTTDIAVVFETHLQEDMTKLKKFWRSRLPRRMRTMTLGNITGIRLNVNEFKFTTTPLSKDMVGNIQMFLKSEGLRLFDFMASLYQLLLHINLQLPFVSVATTVDLRLHFPEIKNYVCRFTNQIPLIASFENTSLNVKQFLQKNKETLSKSLDNSILPMGEISKFVKGCDPYEIRRHLLIMEEISTIDQLHTTEKYNVKVKQFSTTNSDNETMLLVWYDKQLNQIRLELGYSPLVFSTEVAKNLLNSIVALVKNVCGNPNISLDALVNQNSAVHFQHQMKGTTEFKIQRDNINAMRETTKENYLTTNHDANELQLIRDETQAQDQYLMNKNKRLEIDSTLSEERTEHASKAAPITGTFMKETSRGWDHKVHLMINEGEPGRKEAELLWGPSEMKLTRSLPLSRIQTIDTFEINGKYWIVIKSDNRRYTFKTGLQDVAVNWMTNLKIRL